ncbi:DUF2218 domain-containing protein [Bradyrhizobium canariense]|uniref:2,4-dihydroxyhept-2-ene-1,7-dioic acid aldolase n=1 Tax=Bradyrhizobium canariense TaxID=255045 RepID=A0A1H2AI11_9BRAD|nr:DUF2218 domain-containing protein [Bradyrhizobium canariense]SDT45613.1 hypothetical protein SAMN05444158_6180 [Bradyrhizobium canariense]
MPERRAEIHTKFASRSLQQLCKHWSHRFVVDFTPSHGEIALPLGRCVLDAEDERLVVVVSSIDPASLPRLQDVVEEHLKRFAFREALTFHWSDRRNSA